jgi:MYXO-CTERM domain-containing protein
MCRVWLAPERRGTRKLVTSVEPRLALAVQGRARMRRDIVVFLLLAASTRAHAESPPPPPLTVYSVFEGQRGVPGGTTQSAPDVGGAAGPLHAIDVVSGFVTIRNSATGQLITSSTADAFWTAAGVTGAPAAFSQHAVFSAENQRWYISAEEDASGAPNRIYLAVSATHSALGPWKAVELPARAAAIANTQLAVDPCGAYITGDTGGAGIVVALPFVDLQWGANAPTAAHLNVLSASAGVVPAIDPWNEIGSNARMFVARTPGSASKIDVYKLHWSSGMCSSTVTATLTEPTSIELGAAYPAPSRAAVQPPPAPGLAAGTGQIASATSSNGEIVGIATTEIGGQLAAFWFELYMNPTGPIMSLEQVGTITTPGADLIAPAIALDSYNGLGMVLVRSSETEPPSIFVTGHPYGDVLGTTQPLTLARAGTAAYSCAPAANVSAFGRYSSIASTATGFYAVAQYGASSTACEFGTAWVNFGVHGAPVTGDLTTDGDDHDHPDSPDKPGAGCGCATGNASSSSAIVSVVAVLLLATLLRMGSRRGYRSAS